MRGTRQREQIDEARADFFVFILRIPSELHFRILNFLDGQLGGVQRSWNLRIQIPADEAAGRDGGHDPERHAGDSSEFKRRVQRDHERRRGAQDDVEIQPVARISLPSEPAPPFAKRIEIDQEKHEHAKHAQIDADGAARAQQHVLRRKGAVLPGQRVVIEAVGRECADERHGNDPGDQDPEAMFSLRSFLAEHHRCCTAADWLMAVFLSPHEC